MLTTFTQPTGGDLEVFSATNDFESLRTKCMRLLNNPGVTQDHLQQVITVLESKGPRITANLQKTMSTLRNATGRNMAKKGQIQLKDVRLYDARDGKKFISRVINEYRSGLLTDQQARTLGYLANCFLKAFEMSDLAKKVEEIEQKKKKK